MIVKRWRSCIGSVFYVLWVSCNIEFIKISTISTTLLYTFCKWEYYLLVVDLQTSTIIIQYLPFIMIFHAIFFSAWRKKSVIFEEYWKSKRYDRKTRLRYGADRLCTLILMEIVRTPTAACGIKSSVLSPIRFGRWVSWIPHVPVLPESVRLSWRILPCNTLSAWITY